MKLAIGDWVRSYSAGIWQVYRIEEDLYDLDPISNVMEKRTLVFCKRFLNNSFKKSFTSECCHPGFVYRLDEKDYRKLSSVLKESPELFQKFNQYEPKPIDCIYNLSISVIDGDKVERYQDVFGTTGELDAFEIQKLAESNDIKISSVPDLSNQELKWTIQFCSENHKVRNNRLVYTFSRVLEF